MSLWESIIARRSPVPALRQMRVAGDTHTGRVRKHNEDSYIYILNPEQDAGLFGVADGMGGHEGGEVASYLTMYHIIDAWNQRQGRTFSSREEIRSFLSQTLKQANEQIYRINKKLKIRRPMGTTCTLGVLWNRYLILAHVGDSRCYRVRRNRLSLLTSDQNWMAEMVQTGRLSPMEAAMHPLAKTLSNCVGAMEELYVKLETLIIHEGDRYFFCTDGVSSLIDDEYLLQEIVNAKTPAESVRHTLHQALRNGGLDNLSAVSLFL